MFTPPFRVEPKQYLGTDTVYLIHDATDQLVAATFDAETARLVAARLNPAMPLIYSAAMLAGFRLILEKELRAPLAGLALDAGRLLDDLCDWFGFDPGQRAIVLGPQVAAYVADEPIGCERAALADQAVRIIEVQYA